MPPMPERVRAIKAAIEERQDFTGLANGGEDAVVAWAKERGENGRVLICQWQQNYRERQAVGAVGGRGKKRTLTTNSSSGFPEQGTAARSHDLDFWADDIEPPDDDDDGDMVPCAACDGRGKDAAGNVCEVCGGSGKAPVDEDDNEDDDDDEREREED